MIILNQIDAPHYSQIPEANVFVFNDIEQLKSIIEKYNHYSNIIVDYFQNDNIYASIYIRTIDQTVFYLGEPTKFFQSMPVNSYFFDRRTKKNINKKPWKIQGF